jgi:hypothetical protein
MGPAFEPLGVPLHHFGTVVNFNALVPARPPGARSVGLTT